MKLVRRGVLIVVVLAVVAAIGGGGVRAFDAAFTAPWAWPPGPFLTQSWVGSATSPSGAEVAIHLDLVRAHNFSGGASGEGGALGGRGGFCSTAGPRVEMPRVGGTANRSADEISLGPGDLVDPATDEPIASEVDGLFPGALEGSWDGDAQRLTLAGSLTVRRGGAAVSGADQPDTVTDTTFILRPGDEADFDAACEALG